MLEYPCWGVYYLTLLASLKKKLWFSGNCVRGTAWDDCFMTVPDCIAL